MSQPDRTNDKYNFLLYRPEIVNAQYRLSTMGRVVLDLKINPVKKLLGKLVNKKPHSDIELDDLASKVWLTMDGSRTILDIARIQSAETGDDIDEAVRRTVQFVRYISKRGWIRYKQKQPNPHEIPVLNTAEIKKRK